MTTEDRSGVQGWQQFLTSKADMLSAFDQARTQSRSHEIETYHGTVAEAQFRRWLLSFLPKRYGVTPGYVVSQGLGDSVKLPHFDVIIYDQLESPVLWVEQTPDASEQGMSRAIPTEYVGAIVEVKAAFTAASARETMAHLQDLGPLLLGGDVEEERYKRFLPRNFFSAAVFFELRKADEFSAAALDHLPAGLSRGFCGGLILRGEGRDDKDAGHILMLEGAEMVKSTVGRDKESLIGGSPLATSTQYGDQHIGALLTWSPASFSMFAFDLVARLNGTYRPGFLSSSHAMNFQKSPPRTG